MPALSLAVVTGRVDSEYPPRRTRTPDRIPYRRGQLTDHPPWVCEHVVLPQSADAPSKGFQLRRLRLIATHILGELGRPERVRGPGADVVLGTAVPEAPVDEHGDAGSREHDVRPASRGRCMEAVAEPGPPEEPANQALGAGMPSSDPCHLIGTSAGHADKG